MGDGLKLCKDKRHRSSSSLSGGLVEGTRSERKIDVRASIPEVDDHFAIAEARCDDLQEKIDLVKMLKKRKKLKKRSTTRVAEAPVAEHVPFISVRTQPKKKVSQQAVRLRRLEVPPNPTRGYLDSATVEQHDMLGHVSGYHQKYRLLQHQQKNKQSNVEARSPTRVQQMRQTRADGDEYKIERFSRKVHVAGSYGYELGDIQPPEWQRNLLGVCGQGVQISTNISSQEVTCGEDLLDDYSDSERTYERRQNEYPIMNTKKRTESQLPKKPLQFKVRNDPRDVSHKAGSPKKILKEKQDESRKKRPEDHSAQKHRRETIGNQINIDLHALEERPVVELFNKSRESPSPTLWHQKNSQQSQATSKKNRKGYNAQRQDDEETGPLENAAAVNTRKEEVVHRHPRRVKYRSRRYELPTVASQMKQAGMRCYYGTTNHTNIPFVVSKSTTPSHNIGMNIQQVLNGLKIQQPLSGIPSTIAHHMGLGHVSSYGTKSLIIESALDNREINVIRVGKRLVRLPSCKCMSYNRMLALYREGDGMVPRFLRAIGRPHFFYTSMYNLVSNRDDPDGATSKGRVGSQEAKASLAEYASLYRQYEQLELSLSENYDPEVERRKETLARQLAAREEHIRKVVEEFHTPAEGDQAGLRASASTAEDAYRHSTFKLNSEEPHP